MCDLRPIMTASTPCNSNTETGVGRFVFPWYIVNGPLNRWMGGWMDGVGGVGGGGCGPLDVAPHTLPFSHKDNTPADSVCIMFSKGTDAALSWLMNEWIKAEKPGGRDREAERRCASVMTRQTKRMLLPLLRPRLLTSFSPSFFPPEQIFPVTQQPTVRPSPIW